jgi:hypothetical protein
MEDKIRSVDELLKIIEKNKYTLKSCSSVIDSNPAKAEIDFAVYELYTHSIKNLQTSIENNSRITSRQNKIMILLTVIIVLITLVSIFCPKCYSQEKSFIREYNYKASETDSKVSSRQKALQEVKALLIEELGTYVESYVNYQVSEENKKITKDFFTNEIKTLSAGTTELTILEESWDGYEYYVKSEIKADPNEIITRINQTLSIREKNLAIDSLKTLLTSSNSKMQLKDAELAELQKKVTQQNQLVSNKENEVKNLQKQLTDAKSNLAVYEAQKQQVLTEI